MLSIRPRTHVIARWAAAAAGFWGVANRRASHDVVNANTIWEGQGGRVVARSIIIYITHNMGIASYSISVQRRSTT